MAINKIFVTKYTHTVFDYMYLGTPIEHKSFIKYSDVTSMVDSYYILSLKYVLYQCTYALCLKSQSAFLKKLILISTYEYVI